MKVSLMIGLILLIFTISISAQTKTKKLTRQKARKVKNVVKPDPSVDVPNADSALKQGINPNGNGTGTGIKTVADDGIGSGKGTSFTTVREPPPNQPTTPTTALKILFKSKPAYTVKARENNVTGTVRLRITFLDSGKVGEIKVVSGLPDGLTENAVNAARLIKFEPARQNNLPITVTKIIEYPFTIY